MMRLVTREGCNQCALLDDWLHSPEGENLLPLIAEAITLPSGELSDEVMADLDMMNVWGFPSLVVGEDDSISGVDAIIERMRDEAKLHSMPEVPPQGQ